jgi:hypothetical protein
MHRMADRKSSKPKKPKTARWQRIAMMDREILDVEGAATLLGVSTSYKSITAPAKVKSLPHGPNLAKGDFLAK